MTFHFITLFPRAFRSYLGESILQRAIKGKKIAVKFYNPRDFGKNKRRRIDRAPYGGGPGMVIQAEPVIRAVEAALAAARAAVRVNRSLIRANKRMGKRKVRIMDKGLRIIWLTPSGKQFTNATGIKLAKDSDIIVICGRYEGIDARVKRVFNVEEISLGPYVLTGGELPALVLLDVVARQVPGVLGDFRSREEARHASRDVYTRPEAIEHKGRKLRVPKVLLSGHHARIEAWRAKKTTR